MAKLKIIYTNAKILQTFAKEKNTLKPSKFAIFNYGQNLENRGKNKIIFKDEIF